VAELVVHDQEVQIRRTGGALHAVSNNPGKWKQIALGRVSEPESPCANGLQSRSETSLADPDDESRLNESVE